MTIIAFIAALLLSQVAPQQAYILDHPIDPDKLLIATQDGRYSFALLAITDCSWVHSDMDVDITSQGTGVWQVTNGPDVCSIVVDGQVDTTPCFVNDVGNCDIEGEHQWT